MDIKEDQHFKDFIRSRNIRKSTARRYETNIKLFCQFLNKTPTEVIEEAEQEEEERLRMKKRKIKRHLMSYTEYLESQNVSPTYIQKTMVSIRTFYREFEIELPHPVPIRNDEQILITTDNMINKDHIRKAVSFANKKYQAIILLGSSSGMGAAEMINLTFGDFLKALEISEKRLPDMGELTQLLEKRSEYGLIPTWRIKRYKTGMPYFTFSSPESTRAIMNWLQESDYYGRYPTNPKDWLFYNYRSKEIHKIDNRILGVSFGRLNDKCGFGHQGRLRFFRSHNLRKFFATTLQKNGVQQIITDWLLGHKLNPVTGAYFKPDIQAVKQEYMKALPDLSLRETNVKTIHSKEYEELVKQREDEQRQYQDQLAELKEQQKKLDDKIKMIDRIEEKLNKLG